MQSYSNDQLHKVSDDDLGKEYMTVRAALNISKKKKIRTVNLEIYFCYISREIQDREQKIGSYRKSM